MAQNRGANTAIRALRSENLPTSLEFERPAIAQSQGPTLSYPRARASERAEIRVSEIFCHNQSPLLATRLRLRHPSSVRTRAADRLYLGARVAAPKEGAVNTATSRARVRRNAMRPWGSCARPD
jgi:hypothetical protein